MISYPPHRAHPSSSTTTTTTNRPSPRQLQGPRPTPLKVRKDSYKINKKPPAEPANPNLPPPISSQPPRPPVIIYTVSPKIIHTNPSDFMTLVQRLTGPDSPTCPSPAARFAAIHTADKFSPRSAKPPQEGGGGDEDLLDAATCSNPNPPGILSPVPSSLPPISSSFFSPISTFDAGAFGFLQDLSPGPNAGFLISPRNLMSAPAVPSPGAAWDIFNQF